MSVQPIPDIAPELMPPPSDHTGVCEAAHPEDRRPCEGPQTSVRIVDRLGVEALGCVRHAAAILASMDGGRVYPVTVRDPGEPLVTSGLAIQVYERARRREPYDFTSPDSDEQLRAAEPRLGDRLRSVLDSVARGHAGALAGNPLATAALACLRELGLVRPPGPGVGAAADWAGYEVTDAGLAALLEHDGGRDGPAAGPAAEVLLVAALDAHQLDPDSRRTVQLLSSLGGPVSEGAVRAHTLRLCAGELAAAMRRTAVRTAGDQPAGVS